MNSAEFARVKEVTPIRTFEVKNDDGEMSVVNWDAESDSLFCRHHVSHDGCTCTARVRLSGIVTNTVVQVSKRHLPTPVLV